MTMTATDPRVFIPLVAPNGFDWTLDEMEKMAEAGEVLAELNATFAADPHKAVEDVQRLDVYRARRVLAVALASLHRCRE